MTRYAVRMLPRDGESLRAIGADFTPEGAEVFADHVEREDPKVAGLHREIVDLAQTADGGFGVVWDDSRPTRNKDGEE